MIYLFSKFCIFRKQFFVQPGIFNCNSSLLSEQLEQVHINGFDFTAAMIAQDAVYFC